MDTAPSGESARHQRSWRYDERGLLERSWSSGSEVETSYVRDALGRVERRIERPRSGAVRETVYTHDEAGFLRTITNPLGQVTRFEREPVRGLAWRITDANQLSDLVRHDLRGRPRELAAAGRAPVAIEYLAAPSGCGSLVRSTSGGTRRETVEFDPGGRETLRTWQQWDGAVQRQIRYDQRGLPAQHSLPAVAGSGPQWLRLSHDNLGRLDGITHPDGAVERWQYRGRSVRHLDRQGRWHTVEYDQDGLAVRAEDRHAETVAATTYTWGPFGRLRSVRDAEGNVRETRYDGAGRPHLLLDPDRGAWELGYDAWGQLADEIGPGVRRRYLWDALGRPLEQHTEDGVTRFVWDTAAHGIGQLHQTESPDGVRTVHTYDAAGRPDAVDVLAAGRWYRTRTSYDQAGQLAEIVYPAGPAGSPLRVQHTWRGEELEQLSDAATGRVFWKAQRYAPSGLLTEQRAGNGVQTRRIEDPQTLRVARQTSTLGALEAGQRLVDTSYQYTVDGDLAGRRDELAGTWERAGYDPLRRLASWTTSDGGDERYHHSPAGRLTRVEHWRAGRRIDEQRYGYGALDGAGAQRLPGAVTSVNERSYQYDELGRQTGAPGRAITYTAFDLPRRISTGGQSAQFAYDALQRRVLTRGPDDLAIVTIGALYEQRIPGRDTVFSCAGSPPGAPCGSAPGAQHRATLHGPDGPVAELRWVEGQGGVQVLYLHTDPQGTVLALSDEAGEVVEQRRFDPWGASLEGDTDATPAGYTGHRHEPAFGLIDMRGRFYDPALRRFLSPDPLASLGDPQGQDPYAYARNSPLTFTDPSGFIICADMCPGPSSGAPAPNGGGGGGALWGSGGILTSGHGSGGDSDHGADHGSGGGGDYVRGADGTYHGGHEVIVVHGIAPPLEVPDARVPFTPGLAPGRDCGLVGGCGGAGAAAGRRISHGHEPPAAWQYGGTPSPGRLGGALGTAADILVGTACVLLGCNNAWAPNDGTRTQPRRALGAEMLRYGVFFLGGTAAQVAIAIAARTGAAITGFVSFQALKRALGPAGPGMHWHHIVPQHARNVQRFGAGAIHNTGNVISIPAGVHAKISGIYNSKPGFTGGLRIIDWLSRQSYEEQYEFGVSTLQRFGVLQ